MRRRLGLLLALLVAGVLSVTPQSGFGQVYVTDINSSGRSPPSGFCQTLRTVGWPSSRTRNCRTGTHPRPWSSPRRSSIGSPVPKPNVGSLAR